MTLIEDLLHKFGPGALNILKKNSINIVTYAWPLFDSGFACCLPEKSWRQLWDHIVCNRTAFFVSTVVAFISCTEPLMREASSFKVIFFFVPSNLNIMIFRLFSVKNMMLI